MSKQNTFIPSADGTDSGTGWSKQGVPLPTTFWECVSVEGDSKRAESSSPTDGWFNVLLDNAPADFGTSFDVKIRVKCEVGAGGSRTLKIGLRIDSDDDGQNEDQGVVSATITRTSYGWEEYTLAGWNTAWWRRVWDAAEGVAAAVRVETDTAGSGDLRVDAIEVLAGYYKFAVLRPTGDQSTQWQTSSGTDHYALVDDPPGNDSHDGDATYLWEGTDGQTDEFTLGPAVPAEFKESKGVEVRAVARMEADEDNLDFKFLIGGVSQGTASRGVSITSYAEYFFANTGWQNKNWTAAQIDAARIQQVYTKFGKVADNLRVTSAEVYVSFEEQAATARGSVLTPRLIALEPYHAGL